MNKFVENVTMSDDSLRIGLYVKNCSGRADRDGFFSNDILTGMLKAADMKRINMISQLPGALMDHVSDDSNACPINKTFTDYVDIMSDFCVITKIFKWNEEKLVDLAARVNKCKRNGISIFGTYKKYNMCTVKWNVLDHI